VDALVPYYCPSYDIKNSDLNTLWFFEEKAARTIIGYDLR